MALRLTGSIDFLTGAIITDLQGIYSGSFSGSGHITSASYAGFALTASHALNGGGGGFPYTGSAEISGSFGVTGSAKIKNSVTLGGGGFQNSQWSAPTSHPQFPFSPGGYSFCEAWAATGCDVNKTLVVAGIDTNFNFWKEAYAYNGTTWSQKSSLPTIYCGQAPMTGDVDDAIIGCDQSGNGNYLNYDGSSNSWAFIGTPPDSCCQEPGLVGNCNNGALQFGGTETSGNSSVCTYCFSGGVWSQCNNLPINVNNHLYAGNPSDAVSLGGRDSTNPNFQELQCHFNWNGATWNTCNPFSFYRINNENAKRQGLTGCTSPTLLYANIGWNAAYDGTTWSIAPSGGTIQTSNWFTFCDTRPFLLTGDNTCALGIMICQQDYSSGNTLYGCLTEYCYGTPTTTPTSIWCTPSSPTLYSHAACTFRIEGGLAGCTSAALVYGGRDTNFNNLSSADFYNGTTWSITTNGPAKKTRMIGGGSANESIWVGGNDFNDCNDHFEYNSGTWSVCAFTNFSQNTDADMGAGSQPAFKIVGCQGHYDWNGSSWNSRVPSPPSNCGPSGFGTQNDFLQIGGFSPASGFNSTTDVYHWNGSVWNACNSTPYSTQFGGGAGSVSNGLIYNYSQSPQAQNVIENGLGSLAWNGSTWSSDALINLTKENQGSYQNNSNSALTPETAMIYGASNNSALNTVDEPRCSQHFTTYSTNIGGGTTGVCDVAKFEDGMVVLPLVQTTFDYNNDTEAATGGIPLGGLYRSGSFIKIRLT